ncbi:MAG: chaperone protein ClpB [Myxococcales bacterium 68-20]|nr:AAA family ATPase [Myxococcales bacterium]OJY16370.1 MAG: chaperone protein ClpB [Myxococcales bacterium 68-20]
MASEQTIHLERYAPDAKALVAGAQTLADERKHVQVEPIHLLARSLDRDRGVAEVFKKAGADPADVAAEVEAQLQKLTKAGAGLAYLSTAMLQLLGRAEKEADKGSVGVENLLNALSQEIRGPAAVVLQAFALGPGSFRPHMAALKSVPRDVVAASTPGASTDAARYLHDLTARARDSGFDPVIGRDVEVRRLLQILERRQKNHPLLVGEPGVGKTAIVGALAMRIAAGDVPQNLASLSILELETGLLVAGAKLRGEIEDRLKQVIASIKGKDSLLFISSLESLLGQAAGGSGVGDLLKPLLARGEVRLLASTTPEGIRKLSEKDPNLLRRFTALTIDPATPERAVEILRGIATRYEAHHKVQIGDPAITAAVRLAKRYVQERALPDSAIDLLDEAAARKRVEIDGLPAHMDDAIRRVASLKAQLEGLKDDVDAMSMKTRERIEKEIRELEPSVAEMRTKLESRRGALAAQAALKDELTKLQTQLEQARKEQNFAKLGELEHVQMPDVRRRLEAADSAVEKAGLKDGVSRVVQEEDVAQVLGDWTGIPVSKMLEAESEKLLKMEQRLSERVVGQDEAVKAISKAVRRGRVGLRDPGKPIGSFLFLGPSGVGKTELAKALAEFLFDDEQSMTRLDMSEFMEKHMAQRLVGAPPGYVDSEEGGFLTEAVRRRPYSVLLFDEVEKAHADVFNLLLQVLDDGRLTDGRGRTADFSNTVVIMTSNIGSQRILETDPKLFESDEGREALRDVLREELKNFLRPEFLNRIDDVIIFRPLSKPDLRGIVDIQLRKVEKLVADRELKLELTEAAKMRLVDIGYEPAFGARPLKRAIVKAVQDPLAEELLTGGYTNGSTVRCDIEGEGFKFIKG